MAYSIQHGDTPGRWQAEEILRRIGDDDGDVNVFGRPVVTLPDSGGNARTSAEIASCSKIVGPGKQFPDNVKNGSTCVKVIHGAAQEGKVADALALPLAVRQIPFTNARGDDNIAALGAAIRNYVIEHPTERTIPIDRNLKYGPGDTRDLSLPVIAMPITNSELDAVTGLGHNYVSSNQRPARRVVGDLGYVYQAIVADVQIHPEAYAAPGKTLAETLADARTRHPLNDDLAKAAACFNNKSGLTLMDCLQVAARNGMQQKLYGQAAPYNPQRYGIPASR